MKIDASNIIHFNTRISKLFYSLIGFDLKISTKFVIIFLNRNVNNLDTSVPSIHSSGCDSGVGLTTQLNVGSNKQLVQLMRSSQRENMRDRMITDKRVKRCVCGYAAAGAHVCNAGEESR